VNNTLTVAQIAALNAGYSTTSRSIPPASTRSRSVAN